MADKVGWQFPPTNGGLADGFNNSGIAHFSGKPVASLARETIQNSLDAKVGASPVEMSFEIQEIKRPEALGRDELIAAIKECLKKVHESGDDDKARTMFNQAVTLLQRPRLSCLRIADRNTTGLHDKHWRALVKMQGASVKEERGAGGSHGIGKNAPFAVSSLRTVYYWTRFDQDGSAVELFQGKAVLISHEAAGESGVEENVEKQGTGFYGIIDKCRELRGEAVPERISRIENEKGRGNGTSLWIAGFDKAGNWQRRIAGSVIGNFFYAIEFGALCVTIDPSEELKERQLVKIEKKTISRWFEYLLAEEDQDGEEGYVMPAHEFWKVIRSGDPVAEKEDNDLGHVRLWIRVLDGLPKKVGLVRRTGMLITTEQRGLLRFPGFRDFISVCVFDSQKGNELLRGMENPQHDQFEPERLADDRQRRRGRAALKRVTKWIRSELTKLAVPTLSDTATDLDELAQFLPDEEGIDPPSQENGEVAFDGSNVIRIKPRRMSGRESSLLNGHGG